MPKKKKTGRPRKHRNVMGNRVTVRLTNAQSKAFGRAAGERGMVISEWLRWLGDRSLDNDAGNVVDS